jgi:hypothetical protein
MGLMSAIFGSGGSDKADKLRQQAIDAFNAVKTPELQALQVQLDKYVQAGTMTPDQAEASLLSSNAYNDIVTDPSLVGAQKQALQSLQDVGNAGGLTAIDKARLSDIRDSQNQDAKGRLASIESNARERGVGGSGLELVSALQNEQSAADRAAKAGTDVAATAQSRALSALLGAGEAATSMRGQDYAEQANKAAAENAIQAFNKRALDSTNKFNVENANAAQAANLTNAQNVSNANTNIGNQNKIHNANANQQVFNDNLALASGKAGVDVSAANAAQEQAAREQAGDLGVANGIIGGAARIGATAMGGPAAGAAASSAGPSAGGSTDPWGAHNNEYDFAHGGKVPGLAPVPGDSPKNDVVDAHLSPGEVVVPRSAMNDEEDFNKFMSQFAPPPKAHKLETAKPEVKALANLHKRISELEKGK